ncbi:ribokinase [Litoricolaceae bacterium]|nr:ribokinase [Litorivicinaceae bacterium]
MAVIVFGSANVDISVDVESLPKLGETKHGSDYRIGLGGKGLNQAVAANRLSKSPVKFIGAVGTDHFGSLVETELTNLGLATCGIRRDSRSPTGLALIHVDGDGNNSITVSGGANLSWTSSQISELTFDESTVGLCQLETPLEVTLEVMKKISKVGGVTILDPAPMPKNDIDHVFTVVDILTPNQHEAERLLNQKICSSEDAIQGAIALVKRGGFKAVILTMGEQGVAYSEDGVQGEWLPAFIVDAIDTVAAGDCFNGALAAAMVDGESFRDSILFAMAAAAMSVTRRGASSSIPSLLEVQDFLARLR